MNDDSLPIPDALADDYADALCGAPPTPALQLFFASNPSEERAFDELRQVASLWTEDAESVHPTPSFFTSLHDDILSQLPPAQDIQDLCPEPAQNPPASFFRRLRQWWDAHAPKPAHTLAFASVVAACVVALIFALQPTPSPSFEPSFASYDPAQNLSDAERRDLRAFAQGININLDSTESTDLSDDAQNTALFSLWDEGLTSLSEEGFQHALDDLKESL